MGEYSDLEDHFTISEDGGVTWGPLQSTGIRGQTMTPIWLGADRLLVLYNRRYGKQGVIACLVRFTDTSWTVDCEQTLWDARASREAPEDADGINELETFAFGLPSAIALDRETLLCVHWCKEQEKFGIRWTRIHVGLD